MGAQRPALAQKGRRMSGLRDWLKPHRIVMIALFVALVVWCAFTLRWD